MSESPDIPRPGTDEFDHKKHGWDGNTWWTPDREHWWDGYRWQPKNAPAQAISPAEAGGLGAAATPVQTQPAPAAMASFPAVAQRPVVQVTVSAGTAFKIGFFGAIGGVIASAVFWVILVVVFGSCIAAALRPTAT